MSKKKDYKLGFVITRKVCSHCGAVHVPDCHFNIENCDHCKAAQAIKMGKLQAEVWDIMYPPTRVN